MSHLEQIADEIIGPLVSPLATALFVAALGFGVWVLQQRRQAKDERTAARAGAYLDLGRTLLDLGMFAHYLGALLELRTGAQEGINVALWKRKPVDAVEMFTQFQAEFKNVSAAVTQVQAHGDQQGIDLANRALEAAMDLIDAAKTGDQSRGAIQRFLLGERRSPAQIAKFDEALKRLGQYRLELIALARQELGHDPVILRAEERPPADATRNEPVDK